MSMDGSKSFTDESCYDLAALGWLQAHYLVFGSHAPALQLGSDTVTASDHVRVLTVTISSDRSLKKHVSKTCTVSFHWLR